MSSEQWYDSIDNLRNLAEYIIDKDGAIDTVHFLEKPYNYQEEYDEMSKEKI